MANAILTPVVCNDCRQVVPFGWVMFGTVKCPDNIGATGIEYGHRIARDEYDALENAMAEEQA
jgi:hypothetical protein